MVVSQFLGVAGLVGALQAHGGGVFEPAAGLNHVDLAAFGQLAKAAGERGDDLILTGPKGIDFDFGAGEFDTPFGHFLGFVDHFGDVEQGL